MFLLKAKADVHADVSLDSSQELSQDLPPSFQPRPRGPTPPRLRFRVPTCTPYRSEIEPPH
jgi:hypothetical protein